MSHVILTKNYCGRKKPNDMNKILLRGYSVNRGVAFAKEYEIKHS